MVDTSTGTSQPFFRNFLTVMRKNSQLELNEQNRLFALDSYGILDARADKFLDQITNLTAKICETPIALMTLLDEKRQWFKSKSGITIKFTPRNISFCHYAIQQKELFIVEDTLKNPLFRDNPLVKGIHQMRFYAGMPLTDANGFNLGTLCVIDHAPKKLTAIQKSTITTLANSIMDYLSLRRNERSSSLLAKDLHNLFLNAPDLICTASPDGYFKKVSLSFIKELGYTESELRSQPFINLVHPEDRDETVSVLKQLGSKGAKVKFFRNRYRCKNGSYLWLSWNAISNNTSGQIIATARNIAEKIQMEKEMQRLIEEEQKFNEDKILQLSMLTSALSHEMLNPLNMVLGFSGVSLELLDEILSSTDESLIYENLVQIRSDLLKVKQHAGHMSDVVGNMASIEWNSNFYTDSGNQNGQSFRINRVIDEAVKLAFEHFKNKNPDFSCVFESDYDEKEPRGILSVHDFSKSVMNIFYNAFEAICEKQSASAKFIPIVRVKTELFNKGVNICISNNGTHIPGDQLNKVFNPFYTTKATGKGLGLGLCISYNIIKMHHGSIMIEKSDETETVFKIHLPTVV